MSIPSDNELSCQEIIELINELVDGDISPERLKIAEALLEKNPECRALYGTLHKTIDLYRMRKTEMGDGVIPTINWDELIKKNRTDET